MPGCPNSNMRACPPSNGYQPKARNIVQRKRKVLWGPQTFRLSCCAAKRCPDGSSGSPPPIHVRTLPTRTLCFSFRQGSSTVSTCTPASRICLATSSSQAVLIGKSIMFHGWVEMPRRMVSTRLIDLHLEQHLAHQESYLWRRLAFSDPKWMHSDCVVFLAFRGAWAGFLIGLSRAWRQQQQC